MTATREKGNWVFLGTQIWDTPKWVPCLSLNPYSHVLILFGNNIARSVLWTLDHDDWICFFLSYPEPAPLQSSSKRITTHFPATVPFSPRIWIWLAYRQNLAWSKGRKWNQLGCHSHNIRQTTLFSHLLQAKPAWLSLTTKGRPKGGSTS